MIALLGFTESKVMHFQINLNTIEIVFDLGPHHATKYTYTFTTNVFTLCILLGKINFENILYQNKLYLVT